MSDSGRPALLARLRALERLQLRCQERKLLLRQSQVSIMMERNFFLRKVREIEAYGRAHHWGKPIAQTAADNDDDSSSTIGEAGAPLLRAIAAVLYDSRSNPATPRAVH